MAEKLKLELVTPSRKVLSEEVDEVTAIGTLGEFGILPGHAPFLTSLNTGELSYKKGGSVHHLAVGAGYFEVTEDQATVLVNSADRAEEIDLQAAREQLATAEEALKSLTQDDPGYRGAEAAVLLAHTRILV